jgi:hypothetical protein
MRRQLLVSTATAAILSGLVFASAQDMPRGGGKQDGTTQSQGPPGGAQQGESQSGQGMPQRQNNAQGSSGERDMGKGKQAQPKPDRDRNQQTTGQGQRDQGQRDPGKAQQAQPKTDRSGEPDRTVGQGRDQQGRQDNGDRASSRGRVELNVEQRARIRESVFARSDVPRVTSVNFNLVVGTVLPPRVRVAPVPEAIVEIRPEFRNHQYFVVRDEIVILDNQRRIVARIPVDTAGGSGSAARGGGAQFAVDLSPDEIREVQRVLIQRGFSVELDGVLGPRTRQALIQFQQRQGLQATGQIDSRTIAELGVSVRSGQGGGADQQPSTAGQGGAGQGSAQPPSNQGSSQPQE